MRNQILSYVNRTLAMINGEERKAELEFLRAAQKWCEKPGNPTTFDSRSAHLVDTISTTCDNIADVVLFEKHWPNQKLTERLDAIKKSLDWLECRVDPNTLLKEVQTTYPGDWRINEDSRYIYLVVGEYISVVVSRERGEVDFTVWCAIQSFHDVCGDLGGTDTESLPEALADAIVQVVASPREWQSFEVPPTFDPALIPEWLKGPLKEALRPEHERIDRMFQEL